MASGHFGTSFQQSINLCSSLQINPGIIRLREDRTRFFGKVASGRPRMRGPHENPSRLEARPDVPFDTSNRIDALITRCSCKRSLVPWRGSRRSG